jgi:hypothetical protein
VQHAEALSHHEFTCAPIFGAVKTFLADRDSVLCWPPKISLITADAACRAVRAAGVLPSAALAKLRQAVARTFGAVDDDANVDIANRGCAIRRWSVLIMRAGCSVGVLKAF